MGKNPFSDFLREDNLGAPNQRRESTDQPIATCHFEKCPDAILDMCLGRGN